MAKFWEFLRTVFGYKTISGAVVLKVLQMVLPLFGVTLSPDQAGAVEGIVDALMAILVAFGVWNAHNAEPTTVSAPFRK